MQLYLETGYESDWAQGQWERLAALWQAAGHVVPAATPRQADAVLITVADPRQPYPEVVDDIARSAIYREFRDKCFVFDTQDSPLGLYPGLYCSLRRYLFSPSRHRTGCYMQSFNEFIRDVSDGEPERDRKWLLSFQGNQTSATRMKLFATDFKRADVLIERTQSFWSATGDPAFEHFKRRYAEVMAESRFVLCPRGIGTSSFRLFETMQSGSVPVLLSDSWIPISGIDWTSCALRVSEADIARLPEICLAHEGRWAELAGEARRVWKAWFSPDGMGRLIQANLASILATRRMSEKYYPLEWPLRKAKVTVRQTAVRAASLLRDRLSG